MIPVTRCSVVRLIAVTVVISAGSRALATACTGVVVHLVRLADPRCLGIELAIRAEIHCCKRAPAVIAGDVVHHDIRYGTCVLRFQFGDKFAQLRFRAPIAVQIAVLLGDISRAAARLRAGGKPYEVEILTKLVGLINQRAPARIAVAEVAAVAGIAVPVERLQHHIRSLIGYTRSSSPHHRAHTEHNKH